jgi:hypothetical protein
MDREHWDGPIGRGLDDANPQAAEEVVAGCAEFVVGFCIKLATGPKSAGFGDRVEVGGLVKHPEVVVSHEGPEAVLTDEIDDFERVRAVADDIPKVDNSVDSVVVDVFEDSAQCFGVAVDVADNGCRQDRRLPSDRVKAENHMPAHGGVWNVHARARQRMGQRESGRLKSENCAIWSQAGKFEVRYHAGPVGEPIESFAGDGLRRVQF